MSIHHDYMEIVLALIYLFDYEPEPESAKMIQRFRDTAVLVRTAPVRLEVHYYTGQGRETHGSIKLLRGLPRSITRPHPPPALARPRQ